MPPEPSQPFEISEMHESDKPAVVELARTLTQFFPQDVIELIADSLDKRPGLVGRLGNEVVSFLTYALRDSQTAEIVWLGVNEEYHGLGLGTLMLDSLEQDLQLSDVKKLIASTLSYTVPYKPYEKVRTFYYNRGFQSLGIQNNYYDDGLDRLILVKSIL